MPSKKIVIIGASSGIGHQLALNYAALGHRVGITGRRKELLETLAASHPEQIVFKAFDVRSADNVRELKELIQELGGMDMLIFSSGIGIISKQLDREIDMDTVHTNVRAFTEMINWTFNYFLEQGGGHIANISSIASWRGNSWAPAYSASKAFQSNYFEGLYIKARKMKVPIKITDIQPGFVQTKMAQGNRRFWVASLDKACRQIVDALDRPGFRVFITRRWRLIAWIMKRLPGFIYHRLG